MVSVGRIINVVGLVFEFLVVLAIAHRVFASRTKKVFADESSQPRRRRFLSEEDFRAWIFALLLAGIVFQIVGLLIGK